MIPDPEFLSLEDILELHHHMIESFGGVNGIRDKNLLESAVEAPKATFDNRFLHSDIYAMAAAYAFHLAQNQPFIDGNKRTGLLSALVFLSINGAEVNQPSKLLYDAMIDIAQGHLDKTGLATLLKSLTI